MATPISGKEIIGKTVARVEHVCDKNVIVFTDDTFCVLTHETDYDGECYVYLGDEADARDMLGYHDAIGAGLISAQEYQADVARREEAVKHQRERNEYAQYLDLKAKFDGK